MQLLRVTLQVLVHHSNRLSDRRNFRGKTKTISTGLTLHEKDGEVTANTDNGWVSYWQPHGDSELGTAIVSSKHYFSNFEKFNVEEEDLSNAYAHLKVVDNKTTYYAGFTWKESKQFVNKQEWENYINDFSKKINNPLTIVLVN